VRTALERFGSVYEVDAERLAAARPDLVLTQGVCEVCAVPTADAAAAVSRYVSRTTVLALDAHDVAGVLDTIRMVGRACGASQRGRPRARGRPPRTPGPRARVARAPVRARPLGA